jgi:hypothetical protein
MPNEYPHLTPDQVARILEIVQDTDVVIVGGQSVNLWAEHYAQRISGLAERGPFTSKDVDFYGGKDAAEKLADALGGNLHVPKFDEATPNAAVVVGSLDGRKVEIDFMRVVLGVDDASIKNNFVTLRGRNLASGTEIRLMLLHPLDCLRSRFANINLLRREDELSLRQALIAIDVLQYFIDELLAAGHWKHAQVILHDLFFVIRDEFIRGRLAWNYAYLNPLPVMKAFVDCPALDERWRRNNLTLMISRLEKFLLRRAEQHPGDPTTR